MKAIITKIVLVLCLVAISSISLSQEETEAISKTPNTLKSPEEVLQYYSIQLENLNNEIALGEAEYASAPTPVNLAILLSRKAKREIFAIYLSKVLKRMSNLNLNNFLAFAGIKSDILDKQRQLESNYDIIINYKIDPTSDRVVDGLGFKLLKMIAKDEVSPINRTVDVNVKAYKDANGAINLDYTTLFSSLLQTELSGQPPLEIKSYPILGGTAPSNSNLLTKQYNNELEDYIQSLVLTSNTTNNLKIEVYDTLITDKKIIYKNATKVFKVFAEFTDTDTLINKTIKVQVKVLDDESEELINKEVTIEKNKKVQITYDSIPEGKYEFSYTASSKYLTKCFYYRNVKYDFCCKNCGKDLSLTSDKLKSIFGETCKNATAVVAGYFSTTLKKAGFSSCASMAHFFSQVAVECVNLTKFKEDLSYSFPRTLVVFKKNKNVGPFFKQSFWQDKTYLQYFRYKVFELADTTNKKMGTHKGEDIKKHNWGGPGNALSDTVTMPTTFSSLASKTPKYYNAVTVAETNYKEKDKNLFSLIYANMNGNGDIASEDGYNFIGKGAIHVTGKTTYKSVSDRCNELFGTNYNFVTSPELMNTDLQAAIYSGVGYMHWKFNRNVESIADKSVTDLTSIVNGGDNGLESRKTHYNVLKLSLYNCKK